MSWIAPAAGFAVLFAPLLCPRSAAAGELPTAEEILRIHQANEQRLTGLHLQWEHVYETTEAQVRLAHWQADQIENFQKFMAQGKPLDGQLEVDGKKLSAEEAQGVLEELDTDDLKQQAKDLRARAKPDRMTDRGELFLRSDDYQIRRPMGAAKLRPGEPFPTAPVTAESLPTVYHEMDVFSRCGRQKPVARWWHGLEPVWTTNQHLCELIVGIQLPPSTAAFRPQWHQRHLIDTFFSRPAGEYRVLRQEQQEGRQLTVAEVTVPLNESAPANPKANAFLVRAWLDLARGAVPLRVEQVEILIAQSEEQSMRWLPSDIMVVDRMVELPGGGFYPAKTVLEHWQPEAGGPVLTQDEWAEVAAGKRKSPLVVHWRRTWDCSLVEIRTDLDDAFFRLPVPAGYRTTDLDDGQQEE